MHLLASRSVGWLAFWFVGRFVGWLVVLFRLILSWSVGWLFVCDEREREREVFKQLATASAVQLDKPEKKEEEERKLDYLLEKER